MDLEAGYGVQGPWFELYFTDPTSPLSPQGTGGVDGPIVEAIDDARLTIDVAAYSLGLNSVRNALLRAHDRGVTVRIVMETGNMDRSDPRCPRRLEPRRQSRTRTGTVTTRRPLMARSPR